MAHTLNHVSYEELIGSARTPEQGGARRALAVVSDDPVALATASELVDRLGFDAVAVPEGKAGLFRPDGRLFGAWLDAEHLVAAVAWRTAAGRTGSPRSPVLSTRVRAPVLLRAGACRGPGPSLAAQRPHDLGEAARALAQGLR